MRIISKQHDYYDHLQANIVGDSDLKFIRTSITQVMIKWPFRTINNDVFRSIPLLHEYGFHHVYVGFCGENYNGIKFDNQYFYTIDSFHKHIMNLPENDKADRVRKSNILSKYNLSLPNLFKYFTKLDKYEADPKYPIAFATTEFAWSNDNFKRHIYYNCLLRPYAFFKIVNPYEAYSKLESWHANQALPEKPLPIMSDTIKIAARGFDKWSFRKESKKK